MDELLVPALSLVDCSAAALLLLVTFRVLLQGDYEQTGAAMAGPGIVGH